MKDFPLRAWLYTLVVAAAAATAVAILWHGSPAPVGMVFAFGLLFVFAEAVPVELTHVSYSVGFVVAIGCVIAIGPAGAAAAAAFASLDRELRRRPDWAGRLLFNAGQFALSTAMLGIVYRGVGGPVGELTAQDFPLVLGAMTLGTIAFFVTNTLLVSGMVRLVRHVPWRDVLYGDYGLTLSLYCCLAGLGILLGVLFTEVSWAAIPFVLIPLLGGRRVVHTARRARESFDATLLSLITAIEAKDHYTRGHAERVSRLSSLIARAYGCSESKARRIGYAALMHDVGKVTVDTRILQKPGKLTPEEFDHMKVHSARGAEIVQGIDLLADMVDGVRHHHERCDGRGYPDGLDGHALSDVAKIIMVADAFDSMTSTRSYRKAMPHDKALAELHRCEGSQFAPKMVAALERAITRWGWEPAPEEYAGEQTPRPESSPHAAMDQIEARGA